MRCLAKTPRGRRVPSAPPSSPRARDEDRSLLAADGDGEGGLPLDGVDAAYGNGRTVSFSAVEVEPSSERVAAAFDGGLRGGDVDQAHSVTSFTFTFIR